MYNLRKAHNDIVKEYTIKEMNFLDGIMSFKMKLWDENSKKMVPFNN